MATILIIAAALVQVLKEEVVAELTQAATMLVVVALVVGLVEILPLQVPRQRQIINQLIQITHHVVAVTSRKVKRRKRSLKGKLLIKIKN